MSTTQPQHVQPQQVGRRPGVVTFVGFVLYVQALMAVVAAISMLIWRDDILDYLETENSPLSDGAFTGTVIGEFVAALLLFVVGSGIMRGSRGIRLLVAIVTGLNMALAMYILVAHTAGGYVYRAVFSLFVGVFVLWALYGNEESDDYFHEMH